MDSTINLGHIISLLGYLVTTVAAAGAIGVRLNRVERDIERLLGLLEKQGRLEERIRNVEDLVHDRHSRPRD
jgi:hypothetical protein